MASQRITAELRDTLIAAAVNRKFVDAQAKIAEAQEAATAARQEANRLAYQEAFSPDDLKLMKKIPADWLRKGSYVLVRIEDATEGDGVMSLNFGENRPLPSKYVGGNVVARLIKSTNPAIVAHHHAEALAGEHRELVDSIAAERRELKIRVKAIIESVTTTGRLMEIWPECTQLLPEGALSRGVLLPACGIEGLNEELGLAANSAD